MARELRRQETRPSYAAMFQVEDGDGAGPSQQAGQLEDEVESGSDFAPVETGQSPVNDINVYEDEEMEKEFLPIPKDEIDKPVASSAPKRKNVQTHSASRKGKGKDPASKFAVEPQHRNTVQLAPGLSRPLLRQMYTLPVPSVNHRHRAVPVYIKEGDVERLTSPPVLFAPPHTTITRSYTFHPAITARVNKAWGYNVGPGPLWDLMEDRAWYKEAVVSTNEDHDEQNRRPRVYLDVVGQAAQQILTIEDASIFLPSDTITTDEGTLKPPPPVKCSFGLFGKQTQLEMKMFDRARMSEFIPRSKSHVFNAGAPVWGIDWCPLHSKDRQYRLYKQYLAVAPFPSRSHSPDVGVKVNRPSHACIQIWSLGPTRPVDVDVHMTDHREEYRPPDLDPGEMKCELVLCIDTGPAYELKWCPLPSHDSFEQTSEQRAPSKLGLLAGTFEDGSLSIYVVPDPVDAILGSHDPSYPTFIQIPEPLFRAELEETSFLTLAWANSEIIAVGCSNGSIAVYNVREAIKAGISTGVLPTHYIQVHQSAVRALAWIQAPPFSASAEMIISEDPTVIASGGYDGVECMTDIREPYGNMFNRTRDVITCMAYSCYGGGPITIDHENIIKVYQASPSMLGRGHTLLEPGGPVWSVNASEYHAQLAVGSADGVCSTSNILKRTRRAGAVPFFVYNIYQLDYSRKSGEFRMLEQFLPQETQDRPSATRAQKKGGSVPVIPVGTGAWSSEVGVHRVVWNSGNGLSNAPLLASATGSGLCRVDWLIGRWLNDIIPFGGVESMRQNTEMELDDDT